jgi:hypothetical protein
MQLRHGITSIGFALLGVGLLAQSAAACSREAAAAAAEKWTTVFAENNPDTIMALYSKDAVLWVRSRLRCDQSQPR